MLSDLFKGMSYPVKAFSLFFQKPSLFIYMVIPVTITFIILVLGIFFGFDYLNAWFSETAKLGDESTWWAITLSVLWTLILLLGLFLASGYLFVSVTKLFSAPFNDMLSERIEIEQNPEYKEPENWFKHLLRTFIPTIVEEIKKMSLILSGFAVIFVTFIIPFVNILSPILLVAYSIVVLAIDYIDYPLARRFLSLSQKVEYIKTHFTVLVGYGSSLFLLFMIPFIQLFIIPIAVVSGTLLFIDTEVN